MLLVQVLFDLLLQIGVKPVGRGARVCPVSPIIKLDASFWFRCLASRSHEVFGIGIHLARGECDGRVPKVFHSHSKLGLTKHPDAGNSIFLVEICQLTRHLYLMDRIELSHFHIFEVKRARLISFWTVLCPQLTQKQMPM